MIRPIVMLPDRRAAHWLGHKLAPRIVPCCAVCVLSVFESLNFYDGL